MRPEGASLLELIESVADGKPVDWAACEHAAEDDQERRALRDLRVIAGVAEVHWTLEEPVAEGTPGSSSVSEAETKGVPEPHPAQAPPPLEVSARWGHLELIERLGRGSFGEVYRARDLPLHREVALKILRPHAARPSQAERMLREGRMLARVRHPNVVTVHGVETHDGQIGLWMELVRGLTLEELLRRQGPFGAGEAGLIGQDVCRALAAVHAAGLVHRDVKASNIMREEGGRLVLMDFGAGLARGEAEPQGVAVGTPLYLAPEVLAGEEATAQSDVYGVGVLLYHLVSGGYPVKAAFVDELRRAHEGGQRVRLRDARPDLPDAFVRVVERALEPDPTRRYESAGAMWSALGDALGGEGTSPPTTHPRDAGALRRRARRLWQSRRAWAVAAPVLILAGLLALGVEQARPLRRSGPSGPKGRVPAAPLAVIPFENRTGDSGLTHLSDGLAEDLRQELQRFRVDVRGRGSASALARMAPADIARRLHVEALLQGTVSLVNGEVVLAVQLLRQATGEVLWARSYTEPLDRVSGLYRQAAEDLAGAIGAGPTASTLAPPYGANAKAYEAYHKGRAHWERRSRESLLRSVEYFQEAIQQDAGYAAPWAGLADTYISLGVPAFGNLSPQQARRRASEAALRALELDPDLPEAHTSLAFVSFFYDWNWEAAQARFQKALDLNPQYAVAHHWYADYLEAMGRQDEALREVKRAAELDPLSTIIQRDVAWHYFFQRNYDAAVDQLRQVLAQDPTYTPARSLLGRALVERGDYAEGLREIEAAAPGLPRPTGLAFRAYAHAAAGQGARADQLLAELMRLSPDQPVSAYYVALVHARRGRAEKALDYLERGLAEQDSTMVNVRADPRFDALRSHARYQRLVRRMAFPE